jgi:DNA-directed RNA polymerase subunit RPC12/RpoP
MGLHKKDWWILGDEELEDEYYDEEDEDYFDDDSDIDDELEDYEDEIEDDYADEEMDGFNDNYENTAYASYVCDECNYRWEDIDVERKGRYKGIDRITLDDIVCPMCGSQNITKL